MTPEQREELKEINEILGKIDEPALLLIKANAELITQNQKLKKENELLKKAAG